MCLAKAYVSAGNEPVMEDISSMKIDGQKITLRDLFGEEKQVEGAIQEVNFQSSKIVIQAAG